MTRYAARSLVLSIDSDPIGQVTALGKAASTRGLIDASAYGDDWTSYVLGQMDGDELTVTVAMDPSDTGQGSLEAAYAAATETDFSMDHADAAWSCAFPALVTHLGYGGDRDGLLEMEATLKIVEPGITTGT